MEAPPAASGTGAAARAAALATACVSYGRGGPGRALALRHVAAAGAQDIDNAGRKYHLKLVLEDIVEKDCYTVNCSAEVLYHLGNTHAAPDVHFEIEGELKSTDEQDNTFYNRMKSLKTELVAENIPDSRGNVPAELEPLRRLARAAAGYVVWQNSTESTRYELAQVQRVSQAKRSDDYIEFDYTVLLHEFVSQEIIPWRMTVLWHPEHGVKVTQNSRQSQHAEY